MLSEIIPLNISYSVRVKKSIRKHTDFLVNFKFCRNDKTIHHHTAQIFYAVWIGCINNKIGIPVYAWSILNRKPT